MNTADYWPMASEYSIWNAAVVALQFWAADLKAHVLSSVIEQVYNAFFYSTSTHLLYQQSDEILFGHFVTTLNGTFESKLALEDEGYEVVPWQYTTSAVPHRCLEQPSSKYTLNAYVNLEEEDFQTVSLDDEYWDMEEIPDRHLCIHEYSLPHGLCPYLCPYLDDQISSYYDTLDLSDISKFEDLMTKSSDWDIPALDEVGY